MKVAVEGCCHGELDQIYATLKQLEDRENIKVDLLLICGDFQAVRNEHDLESMAVPVKYRQMQTFHKYYSGEATAPVLTVFIGGNHEAASHLWELPFGGWVAPNIYYVGNASVLTYGGLRFGGLSGIYSRHDYMKGHFERPPFDRSTMRSFYHTREVDVFRLKQLQLPMDVFMSHDWPTGVVHHGNLEQLLARKPYFREDIESKSLGSGPAMELLECMRPLHWFSAHLHVKFSAVVRHDPATSDDDDKPTVTKFLALDKCLPRRDFLQVLDFPEAKGEKKLCYDAEWLCVLRKSAELDDCQPACQCMPSADLWQYQPLPHEITSLRESLDLTVPSNFCRTVPVHQPGHRHPPPPLAPNPQTQLFCGKLGIRNIQDVTGHAGAMPGISTPAASSGGNNADEIDLNSDDDDGPATAAATAARANGGQRAANNDEIALDSDGDGNDADAGAHQRSMNTVGQDSSGHCTIGPMPRPDPSDRNDIASPDSDVMGSAEGSTGAMTSSVGTVSHRSAMVLPAPGSSSSSNASRRPSLALPAPKSDTATTGSPSSQPSDLSSSTEPALDSTNAACTQSAGGAQHSAADSSPRQSTTSDTSTATDTAMDTAASSTTSVRPGPRVLKRRNLAMYANLDADSDSGEDDEGKQELEACSKRVKDL